MEVFSGSAKFTTPRPFESCSAEVMLSFTIAPSEDPEAVTAAVGMMARRQALAMIGVVEPNMEVARFSAVGEPAAYVRDTPAAEIMASAKVPVIDPVKTVVVIGDAMGLSVSANPTLAPAPAAPMPALSADNTAIVASPTEIKDGDLHTAAAHAVTRLAPAHGELSSVKVTALIGEYSNPPSMRAIPQDRRREFLDRLAVLA